ncbi:MAG: hypothetical protein AB7V55_03935, partial [Oscillospiraceae bacterium]
IQHCPTANHAGRDLAHFARLVGQGQRFSSRLEMIYARELLFAGKRQDFRSAKPYFEAVRADGARAPEALRRAACVLAQGAAIEQDSAQLLRVAAPELVGTPPAEICCALGDYYLSILNAQQAADWYAAALSGAAPELIAAAAGSQPLEGLAACYDMIGDEQKARTYRAQADAWSAENLRGGAE